MAQQKACQMEPSDLHGLHVGIPMSLFHLACPDPQLSLVGHKVWPLFKQQTGPWPLHLALKISFGAG